MVMPKAILFAIILFISSPVYSQKEFSPETWRFIDTSIRNKRNLNDVLNRVHDLREKAYVERDYFTVARCYYYQLQITDLKTEDTLWFKNSAFIDSLVQDNRLPLELRWCMQVMLGKRLSEFSHRYNRFERSRYVRQGLPVNYAMYSNQQLDSISNLYFEKAKELSKSIDAKAVDKALWLSSNPLQFLFKPHLYDIVIAEQITCIGMSGNYIQAAFRKQISDWMDLSQDEFIRQIYLFRDTSNNELPVLVLYGDWLEYHKGNISTRYFIESLARKYAYNCIKNSSPETASKYENYLEQIAASGYRPVKAHGVYQLCLLWNGLSKKYFPSEQGEYDYATGKYKSRSYDTTYRFHALKALRLFQVNKPLLDSFLYLADILTGMENQIRLSETTVVMERNNLPGQPLLAEVKFKNMDSLYYRIVKTDRKAYLSSGVSYKNWLLAQLSNQPVTEKVIRLPATGDYNFHATYLKIDALPEGNYVLLFSNSQLTDTSYLVDPVFFAVTNIAVVNNDQRVYVLHRKTGMPLTGAKVKAIYNKRDDKKAIIESATFSKNYVVNEKGYVTITDKRYTDLEIYYKADTVFESVDYYEYEKPEDTYDNDEYSDLVEYYEDNATAYIFTDRSIYRPGQTVYYKVLFLTKNRKTGEPMVMSKENMRGKLFGSVYKKWLKEENPWLYIYDAFNKEVDSIKIVPNEFGSVSGSFKIPKTASTGEWSIEPDYIDADYNTGTFKVEEYKRPSYEIIIDKPKKELLPGDPFSLKIKVRSFAGVQLNNVRINYTITRNGRWPLAGSADEDRLYGQSLIVDTAGYTDSDGVLEITVSDLLLQRIELSQEEYNFDYKISVEAVDATGESYEEDASVSVSTRPVSINIPVVSRYDRSDLHPLLITTTDKNAGPVSKKVAVKLFRIEREGKLFRDRKLMEPDTWLYEEAELQKLFPDLNILNKTEKMTRVLVADTIINTGEKEKLNLDPSLFVAGDYEIEAAVTENGFVRGDVVKRFSVLDEKENKLPAPAWSFHYLPFNSVMPGDTLKYFYGSSGQDIYSVFHVVYYEGKKKIKATYYYNERRQSKGLHRYDIKVPSNAVDVMKVTQISILNNQLFKSEETVYISKLPGNDPEIIVEKYRKKLLPGGTETFTVSVKTENENIAAELMTTMYDASLDKLEKHKWEISAKERPRNRYIYLSWTSSINDVIKRVDYRPYPYNEANAVQPEQSSGLLWWINTVDSSYFNVKGDWAVLDLLRKLPGVQVGANSDVEFGFGGYLQTPLIGRVAGLNIVNTEGLDEVVVVGYGTRELRALTTSVIRIRGNTSLSAYSQPLIILDGVPYEGDLSKIDPATITAALVLKGADAFAIYGAKAANGVLVLSTKGEIVFPKDPEPEIVPRKNFSESAFFFPAIYADKNGYYTFSFTIPESVTEWNWKMLAHTKKVQFAYAEKKLNTQLPLMVQPNMPRLLYQGDRIVLQNRISNLDTNSASGNISCKVEDAVTGEDITNNLLTASLKEFTVSKMSNTSSSFEIKVPATQLHPLKITVSVRSENFVDGEEHIIPVLSQRVFVRESKAFAFNKSDTSVQLCSLPADAELYGVGVAINPKPQAALMNALPYLANYPFDCAEQTFNKLLAYLTAKRILQTDSAVQLAFEKAKDFVENGQSKDDKLPDDLAEGSMPWLNMVNNTLLQQKQLFNLLDASRTETVISGLLQKLYKLQNADGGISWFDGGKSDFYISCYLLKGFGILQKEKQLNPPTFETAFQKFIGSLIKYCDENYGLVIHEKMTRVNSFYLYARGYWLENYPFNDSAKLAVRGMLGKAWESASDASLYAQALLIIATFQYGMDDDSLHKNAKVQLRSIRQLAIEDDQNGLRWKSVADSDDLNNSSEEIVALLAEAFEAGDMNINKGIIKWLMTTKSEHHWSTTKATAAVINVLMKENKSVIGLSQIIEAKTGDTVLSVTNDLMKGNLLAFAPTQALPSFLHLTKTVPEPATGNISCYYFTSSEQLSDLNKDVRIVKKMYKWSSSIGSWTLISEGEVLKVAEKVKVVLTVESFRPLSYVYIDDKRGAAFELVDITSGYEYAGFGYYKSVRDAGCHFFADFIPSGRHEISYELKVSQEGNFTCGPTVLQCMYNPEVTAYGNSIKVASVK